MADRLSDRLAAVVDALPLEPGMRVIEIGGAPGAAAREVCRRVGSAGHVLVVDRSPRGIALTEATCAAEIADGLVSVHLSAAEDFALAPGTRSFDLAFACRVGALDGRHPSLFDRAVTNIARALSPSAKLFIDTGDPLTEVPLPR